MFLNIIILDINLRIDLKKIKVIVNLLILISLEKI